MGSGLPLPIAGPRPSRSVIGAQGRHWLPIGGDAYDLDLLAGIVAGTHVTFIYGRIDYRDVFGNRWQTNFRFATNPGDDKFLNCEEGNDAT